MGNNIKLKYSDLSSAINCLNSANNHLNVAQKTLSESSDLGSSIMQTFWKFGNKDYIFSAIKSAENYIKAETEENNQLKNLLNSIESIYENAGKGSSKSVSNSKIISTLKSLGIVQFSFLISPALYYPVMMYYITKPIVKKVSKSDMNIKNLNYKLSHALTIGITPLAMPVGKKIVGAPVHIGNNIATGTAAAILASTVAEEISKDIDVKAGDCLSDIWRNWGPESPNGFTNYNGKGNCTWYVDNRWSQKNPDNPLVFTTIYGRNAKNWTNTIDKNKFDVLSTSDPNNIKSNSVAVSQSGTYGHVAYIESVRDGRVYYTEDGESYTRPHTWKKDETGNWVGPTVQSSTLEEFKYKFGSVITAK